MKHSAPECREPTSSFPAIPHTVSSKPATPIRRSLSLAFGWFADRRIPRPFRIPLYRLWSTLTRSDLAEILLPLPSFPSLGAFFVRELVPNARPFVDSPDQHPSPVDGTIQSIDEIQAGAILQAKGRPYALEELLDGVGADLNLEGGTAITVYLAPHNYHRIHSPESASLDEVHWVEGARYSVNPKVLSAREKVLSINERVVLRMESKHGPFLLVLVGALNVGRIRVVGVQPGGPAGSPSRSFERGEELARFEMGSTIVLIWPAGVFSANESLAEGQPVRMGSALGQFLNHELDEANPVHRAVGP